MADPLALPADYAPLLAEIKTRVRHARTRAVLAVNAELIRLYWEIGALIDQRQQQEGWGAAVIPRLARDLHNELPEEKGFSERNIKRMLAFFRAYPHLNFVPQPVAQKESDAEVPQPAALFPAELLKEGGKFQDILEISNDRQALYAGWEHGAGLLVECNRVFALHKLVCGVYALRFACPQCETGKKAA